MQFVVDSRLRASGTAEEYTYVLWSPIKAVRRLRLLSAHVPVSMYPIVSGYNDRIKIHVIEAIGPTSTFPTVTLASGRTYTGAELATEMQRAIRADTLAILTLVTYSALTNKFTVTDDGAFELNILGGEAQRDAATTQEGWTAGGGASFDSRVGKLIGLSETAAADTNGGAVVLANQVDLSYPRYLYLQLNLSGNFGDTVRDANNSYGFELDLSGGFGDLSHVTVGESYIRAEAVSDANIQHAYIKWSASDPDYPLDFGNVDHHLVFQGSG